MLNHRLLSYKHLILRIFLGLTIMMWGYEKLVVGKLAGSYIMDYGRFLLFDVNIFLQTAGWLQILMGALVILGLFTRVNALIFTMMGSITIIIPGMLILKDVPHFAYAFAFTGASIVMWMEGSGEVSLDYWLQKKPLSIMKASELQGWY